MTSDLERGLIMQSKPEGSSRVYCEGNKLRSALIDIDKSFGLVEEIRARA